MNELSTAEYERLGVQPMAKFPLDMRERINAEAAAEKAPPKWLNLGLARITARGWFEWYIRRGRDPRKRREQTPRWMRRHVIARDGMVCRLCGFAIPDGDLHVDHIQPLSRGGRTVPSNLQPAHSACNIRKSDRWTP